MCDAPVIAWICALQILKEPLNKADPHLGVLTTMNRDDWAEARDQLLAGVCLSAPAPLSARACVRACVQLSAWLAMLHAPSGARLAPGACTA